LPVYVAVNFSIALIKLYALVTITEQKWIREAKGTRENQKQSIFKRTKDIVLTAEIIGSLILLAWIMT
jgi:hypothetical protein